MRRKFVTVMRLGCLLLAASLAGGCDDVRVYGGVGYSSYGGGYYGGPAYGTSVTIGGRIR
ncbi:MAG: hypothetical protein OEW35_03795 [Gammaproteobacteria bacterium]|nr:hypothetical protein [Gammaproteobacteria bacterium]MDH4253479.1 hypothetical protein [Gammaproteobacteria bacterium]MDH5309712.1 hypothetical protein [Gammaproteobacteria bacterium]